MMSVCFRVLVILSVVFGAVTAIPVWAGSLWSPAPGLRTEDARHALPNNPAPPDRLEPESKNPPLAPELEGTIRKVKTAEKVVALTFDLCELETVTTGYNADIIDFLRQQQIPATLFIGGKWMRTHQQRTKELIADPLFEIGNHAWSHGNFGIMSDTAMREQINWTQAQYELLREEVERQAEADGREVKLQKVPSLFRLPYGRCSDKALALLAREGFQVIQWSVVAEIPGDNTAPGLVNNVVGQVHPGALLLFHANRVPKGSEVLLRGVVKELQRRGYRFVSVGELLKQGEPQRVRNGYFNHPGDNRELDTLYGVDGTGRKK